MTEKLSILNDPPQLLEGPQLLHYLINWDKSPSACALDFTSSKGVRQTYSYQELQKCMATLSIRICSDLEAGRNEAESPQHIIPVLLPQAPCLYISQLAILQSGGAFCPITLDAPKERIKFVVGDVKAQLIITTSKFQDVVTWEGGPKIILVDDFPIVSDDEITTRRPSRKATPTELAYVMYTSGSSGLPKGVAVSHLAASQSLLAHERHIPVFKRFLQFAAPSFDVSVFEIFFPFYRGATLVGCDRAQLLNDLPGTIVELEIDAAEMTPTVVGSLLQKRSNAPCLKLLLTIGEMLTRPIVQEFGGSEEQENMLYGMYGPTEAAIHCTVYPKMEASARPGNIGMPLDTVSTFIATASASPEDAQNLQFLPIGDLGELVLGGPQLANGYLNRPDQNKAAFVNFEGRSFYRTGDKARQLADGTIEILGRISAGQVKLRGQRVELGEIEEVVYKYPGIRTVSAMVLGSVLVVFALIGDSKISSEDVMSTCAKWLPKFMIPSEIVLLEEFAYLPSGKVDKKKLEADYKKRQEAEDSIIDKDETSFEKDIKDCVQSVLGYFERMSRLAAAGLDSLSAIKVASKLRSEGFNLTTLAVLQAETLADLTKACQNADSSSKPVEAKSLSLVENKPLTALNGHANDVEYTIPCTPLQSSMLSETAIESTTYWNWVEVELPGIAEFSRVEKALRTLCEHHEILRTGFAESQVSDGFAQIVWKSLPKSHIEEVEIYNYDFDKPESPSLSHPLKFQARDLGLKFGVLIQLHHAIYDAWSLELLLDDLNKALLGETLAHRPSFTDLVAGYESGTLDIKSWELRDYWRDHLLNLDIRQIPQFNTRTIASSKSAVASHNTELQTSEVEAAAKKLFCSPQAIFQAAYSLILSTYVGSSDVCFGTVFSGRTLPIPGIEDIIGPCLSTLPVRIDISTSSTLQTLVQDIHFINRKHMEHSTLPLRDIKATASVHPRNRLFDSLLIWQQTLHGFDHSREHIVLINSVDNLEFNLTLEIIPGNGPIELKATYKDSRLPRSQIDTLLGQVEQVVQSIVRDATVPIEDFAQCLELGFLSTENISPEIKLKPGTLATPIEILAKEDPYRRAIEFASSIGPNKSDIQHMTYFELNAHANKIGHHILAQNYFREVVCICMEKSFNLYSSILATAKLGAGYLPVTPDIPQDRLNHILNDANVKIVLTQSESRHLFEKCVGLMVIYVDELDFSALLDHNIQPRFLPESLSYCVYTSGSTGTPKGVMVTHGNLLSNLGVLQDLYPTSKNSKFLQSCSQAFDVSVFEIFFAWRVGGCLCFATKDVLFRDLEEAIRAFSITHLSMTPTVAALVNPGNVPTVEFLVTAGEAVTQKVFNTWAGRGLYQGYGPSETTNICTVNPNVSRDDSINNIGPPFKNTSAFVLSPHGDFSLVPRGGEGEFCFGGAQVFRGYIDATKDVGRIINHPEYGRIYRSGDFGRLMPDGSLAFTGRKDDQVKIRGQRVELGEINALMLSSPKVHDCVTIVIGDASSSQRLICFWAPATTGSEADHVYCLENPPQDTLSSLYNTLESALPVYMIPSALIPISFLPSTPQGKIDKRYLIALFKDLSIEYLDSTTKVAHAAETYKLTELELQVTQILSEHTQIPIQDINPVTSFFNLGIDSITAIAFARKLRQGTQREVEISDILKHSSVSRLSERISSQPSIISTEKGQPAQVNLDLDTNLVEKTIAEFQENGKQVQSIYPCTPLQEAMLSAADASDEKLYTNLILLDIRADVDKLMACWRQMVLRHENLRTCFVRTDLAQYPYLQVVLKDYELIFGSTTYHDGDHQHAIESVELLAADDEITPPYKIHFLHSESSTKLLVSMHHALYDAVALSVLYDEVEQLYREESLQPAPSFAPFLQAMIFMDSQSAEEFWDTTLGGCTPTNLQDSNQISKVSANPNGARVQRIQSDFCLSYIESEIKKYSTTLLTVCHAVWASVLAEYVERDDVCFGNVVSGRTLAIEGIDRLVAPCFNTIPCRLSNITKLTYLEAFRKLQNLNANSLPFQLSSLRRIQSKFSTDALRLYDTLFILQQPSKDLDTTIWKIEQDDGIMDLPFVIEVVPLTSSDRLELVLHTHHNAISNEQSQYLLEGFEARLQAALNNPRRQVLSTEVKEKILAEETRRVREPKQTTKAMSTSEDLTDDECGLRDIIADYTTAPAEKITRDISIFRLGLDSINTVQVAARLRKQGHRILASDVLQNPTIAKLGAFLVQSNSLSREETGGIISLQAFDDIYMHLICSKHDIDPKQVEAIRPCTAVQKGMIAQSLHSDGQEYVNSVWLEHDSSISLAQLKAAWKLACERNEMLRTGFATTDNTKDPFVMVTYKQDVYRLPWKDSANNHETYPISKAILQEPWSLYVSKETEKTIVRFTAHHALYDAQSIACIFSDVAKAYHSGSLINRPSIDPLLNSILTSSLNNLQEKQDFWQQESNKIIVNKFPDVTPLRVLDLSSGVLEITSTASVAELEESCKQCGVTMQAAGQAAWGRLLAAYIGESSTTFGITLSGRSVLEDSDNIAFPSIVTLPIRCEISGTNQELLARTMESNALLHKHQFTPLTNIQKWAGFPEGKIFDTLFAYQKLPSTVEEIEFPWKLIKEEATVDYAVSLEVQPTESGELLLRLTFQDSLIPEEQAKLLLQQYDAFLQDTLENPLHPSDATPNKHPNLLSITPAKEPIIPGSVTLLHQFVEDGANEWPDRVALEFATCLEPGNVQSKTWTYKQLNEDSNRVSHLLLSKSILPGQLIAICFDKCAEASIAIIGILKAGCAYVALDPNAPVDRMKFMIEDSGAKLTITAGKPGQSIKESLDDAAILLDDENILTAYSSEPPQLARPITPEDTSYCLYTSGTTGIPKGCILTHSNAVQAMFAFQRLFAPHWTPSSKWLQFASFHFDVSVLEQFWSWSVGICVVSAPRDLIFEDIPSAIRELGVTHIDLTPSLARLLHPDDVPSLKEGVFITGGEQLKQEILDVWGEHACIYNGYGPTEATIGVTMYPRVPKNGKPSNIGPAFDNVGSFVLKPNTSLPVLRGAVGELCVSGMLVGKGYLNRPELTTERFPTLEGFNERVYRTGDLVRILHDDTIIFLGRADDQVKLRGQRLELSEINEVIKKAEPGLHEVVTLVLKHTAQQKEQLVTFLVCPDSTDHTSLIATVRDACKSRLPGYMVPTHFIPIKTMLLNTNNKADSKQLAALYNGITIDELQNLSRSSQVNKPWTGEELQIVSTLANALNVDASAITRGSNIFELGMDSISIIGLSRAFQNAGYQNSKLSVIRSNTSIASLVQTLLSGRATNPAKEAAYVSASQSIALFAQKHMIDVCRELAVDSKIVQKIAPCTPIQEGMIYHVCEQDDLPYFNRFEFQLRPDINVDKLRKAWHALVRNLEILRTRFVSTDNGFAQVVLEESAMYESGNDTESPYVGLDKSDTLKRPWTVAITSEIMVLHIFHGLYDGNSLTMMLQNLVQEYSKDISETKDINYGPSFHDALSFGPLMVVPQAKDFWSEHLNGWTSQSLRTIADSTDTIELDDTIPNFDKFDDLRRTLSVNLQAIVQAAYIYVLQSKISPILTSIGIVISGRAIDFDGADDVIGPMFNTIPFHNKVAEGTTWKSLITHCHKFNMDVQDFQHSPLKEIQKWSPGGVGKQLFEALFVFQRPMPEEIGYADNLWTEKATTSYADYPIAFEATVNPTSAGSSHLALKLVAKSSIITEEQVRSVLKDVKTALRELFENVDQVISVQSISDEQNGHAKMPTSQKLNPDIQDTTNIEWTEEATLIKTEIVFLTDIDEKDVRPDSSIFELGLDSIDVIKLSSRLKKHRIELPVSTIMKSQTIQGMVGALSKTTKNQESGNSTGFVDTTSQSLSAYLKSNGVVTQDYPENLILPATPLQEGMYHLMVQSDYEMYFNVDAFKLQAHTDPASLVAAVKKVVEAAPIFSTYLIPIEDPRLLSNYAQIARPGFLCGYDSTFKVSKEQMSDSLLKQLRSVAIDRAKNQRELFQIQYLTIEADKYMIIAVAHALYDGSSMKKFHADIQKAYLGKEITTTDPRPYLEDVFKSTTDEARGFWRSTLANLPAGKFPHKKLFSSSAQIFRATKTSSIALSEIQNCCRTSNVSIQTLGQTCWALVLAHLMGQLDVVFGTVLSCRDFPDADNIMFPLMNTVAVRSVLHGTLDEMLQYMQEMSNTIRQYQHFPLGEAQAIALSSRKLAKDSTFFDTLFIYQGRQEPLEVGTLYDSEFSHADVDFPVCVEMEINSGGQVTWTTACKSTVRTEEETKELLNTLDNVLGSLISFREQSTLATNDIGISICGLPSFQRSVAGRQPDFPIKELHHDSWSKAETSIREALHDVSGVPKESIHKDTTIFELGLDSISVHKLSKSLKNHGLNLNVSTILRNLDIVSMVGALAAERPVEEAIDIDAIITGSLEDRLETRIAALGNVKYAMPVTAGQEYMLRVWQASGGELFYPTFYYKPTSAPLDVKRLQQAWKELDARHDILHTGFVEEDGKMYQVVLDSFPAKIFREKGQIQEPLFGGQPPVSLVVDDESTSYFGIKIHHALYDAFSIEGLVGELQALYEGRSLPSPKSLFRSFVAHSIASTNAEKWRAYLSPEIEETLLPSNGTTVIERTEFFMPGIVAKSIKSYARARGVTTDAVLLSLLNRLVSSKTHIGSKQVLGIYLANRSNYNQEFSAMAAPTLNLVPLVIDNEKGVQQIQEDLRKVSATDMASASLTEIYDWTGVRVNCFINILKDLNEENIVNDLAAEERFVPISPPRREHEERVGEVEKVQTDGYLQSLDIELKFHDDTETLDIGIFGPGSMISNEEAEVLVNDMRGLLVEVVSSG